MTEQQLFEKYVGQYDKGVHVRIKKLFAQNISEEFRKKVLNEMLNVFEEAKESYAIAARNRRVNIRDTYFQIVREFPTSFEALLRYDFLTEEERMFMINRLLSIRTYQDKKKAYENPVGQAMKHAHLTMDELGYVLKYFNENKWNLAYICFQKQTEKAIKNKDFSFIEVVAEAFKNDPNFAVFALSYCISICRTNVRCKIVKEGGNFSINHMLNSDIFQALKTVLGNIHNQKTLQNITGSKSIINYLDMFSIVMTAEEQAEYVDKLFSNKTGLNVLKSALRYRFDKRMPNYYIHLDGFAKDKIQSYQVLLRL